MIDSASDKEAAGIKPKPLIVGLSWFSQAAPDLVSFCELVARGIEPIEGTDSTVGSEAALSAFTSPYDLAEQLIENAWLDANLNMDTQTSKISLVIDLGNCNQIDKNCQKDFLPRVARRLGVDERCLDILLTQNDWFTKAESSFCQLQEKSSNLLILVSLGQKAEGNFCGGAFVAACDQYFGQVERRGYALVEDYSEIGLAASSAPEQITCLTGETALGQLEYQSFELSSHNEMDLLVKASERVGGKDIHNPVYALSVYELPYCRMKGTFALAGLLRLCISLSQRFLPITFIPSSWSKTKEWLESPFYGNPKMRPWIVPHVHPEAQSLGLLAQGPRYIRVAQLYLAQSAEQGLIFTLAEVEERLENDQPLLLREWETEVLAFKASSRQLLAKQIGILKAYLKSDPTVTLRDLAYSINVKDGLLEALGDNAEPEQAEQEFYLAVVARSLTDLQGQLDEVEYILNGQSFVKQTTQPTDIYFSERDLEQKEKLAFVLPGLGAAYPHMLAELCYHFPEVRAMFDLVDELALANSSLTMPSQRIFSISDRSRFSNGETTASLASMEAAVVTVLLAEWAIYTLLVNMGIQPDFLLGCSTGEFAALTMSGAANILTTARTFYSLSTRIAQSIPQDELKELRSLRVIAPFAQIAPLLGQFREAIYLGADLSNEQVLLTGNKSAIEQLIRQLNRQEIEFHYLPGAIPYHTALVEGVIRSDHPELKDLELSAPQIPSWSCSTAQQYPDDSDALKEITTNLFGRPILFRESIEGLYKKGVSTFIEVGPKGALTEVIREILVGRPHVAVAANRASYSALSQFNHLLAILFCQGVPIDFSYLYKRRKPCPLDFASLPEQRKTDHVELINEENDDLVLLSYLNTVSQFHAQLMSVQQNIMLNYLATNDTTEISPAHNGKEQRKQKRDNGTISNELSSALLDGVLVESAEGRVIARIELTLDNFPVLCDHAIGGVVRKTFREAERVCLLPLMLACEMMAGLASHICPQKKIIEIKNIRALRRIRVCHEGIVLKVTADRATETINGQTEVHCAIYPVGQTSFAHGDEVASPALMSCNVVFAHQYPIKAKRLPITQDAQSLGLKVEGLYRPGRMFHGPRMQAVTSIHSISAKQIEGTAVAQEVRNWTKSHSGARTPEHFLINPSLLDNATQLVLFQLFERDISVQALLPFLIESICFYSDLSLFEGSAQILVHFNSNTDKGTDADIFLSDENNNRLVEFNSICSRRIFLQSSNLAEETEKSLCRYLNAPDQVFLSESVSKLIFDSLETDFFTKRQVKFASRAITTAALPIDQTALAWFADYVLTPHELLHFESLRTDFRRQEWLTGRIAGKEALRELVERYYDYKLCAADFEIMPDQLGRPQVISRHPLVVGVNLQLSIAHKFGQAVAIAVIGEDTYSIGIDLEAVEERESGWESLALTEEEKIRLAPFLDGNRDLTLARAWASKEAVGKALGDGLGGNPKSLEIVYFEGLLEHLKIIKIAPQVVSSSPNKASSVLPILQPEVEVYCHKFDNFVLAIALA